MSKFILSVFALFISLNIANAYCNKHTATETLKGYRFSVNAQIFVSHEGSEGTSEETISHPGDYIEFGENGTAYMFYDGKLDSVRYYFTEDNKVSFGDTPFEIKITGADNITLYQKETEQNGDYNSVTYKLIKTEQSLSFSK